MRRYAAHLVLAAALLSMALGVLRFTFGASAEPSFRNYGVVQTSLGTAVTACGGEASDGCGVDTAIRFQVCSLQFREYFDSSAGDDQLVRALIRKPPPSGSRWIVECGSAEPLLTGR